MFHVANWQKTESETGMEKPNQDVSGSPSMVRCEATDGFKQWMANYGGSIVFTTRRSGKLCLLGWDGRLVTLLQRQMDLPMGVNGKASVGLKIGQAWHPMAADHPHLFSLEVGAPFGPFSRTPLVQMDANLGDNWVVSGAAIWQMQYQSTGPVGTSAIYMKYGKTPELYAAVAYKSNGFLLRAGADLVSIKPRVLGKAEDKVVKVSDRKTSLLGYVYTQYTYKKFAVKAKTTFGEGGEHMNLMSGYAKVGENSDGSWNYASMRNSSSWLSMTYGKKWQGVLFLGYVKNLGLADAASGPIAKGDVYFCSNGFSNINQMYRINPQLIYNIGKMNIGLEYQFTGVQYGEYENGCLNKFALADKNLHWVGNHRVNMMIKYNF